MSAAPRALLRLAAALGLVAGVGLLGAPAAAADTAVDRAVAALQSGPGVYVDPAANGKPIDGAAADRLKDAVSSASTPLFVAALGEPHSPQARADLRILIDRVHKQGTYVVVGTGGFLAASDVDGVKGQTASLTAQATDAHPGDVPAQVEEFVALADAAAGSVGGGDGNGTDPGVTLPGEDTGSGHSVSPLVPVLFVGGIAALIAVLVGAGRRRRSRADAAALAEVSRAAERDVTSLGEALGAVNVPPAGAPEATADYQAALDAYDASKAALASARRPEDLGRVTYALEEGRWRLACAQARLAGRPMPERRPPCFFNPQHGPSTVDVAWAPAGGAPRQVPVCAADADRLVRGEDPDARMVSAGGRLMPYWQAPAYYGPYAGGFFGGWGGGSFLGGLLLGEMLVGPGLLRVGRRVGRLRRRLRRRLRQRVRPGSGRRRRR